MNGKGTKIAVVILIIVCLFMGGGISNLQEEIDNLYNQINMLENRVMVSEDNVSDLEAQLAEYEEGSKIADTSYGIKELDLENGKIIFEFTITPRDLRDDVKVIVDNTIESVELAREGNSFIGTLAYPIDEEFYDTKYFVYSGDYMQESCEIEYLGAGNWAEKSIYCSFDGVPYYGNDKLTLAGYLCYTIDLKEDIKSAKIVFKDSEIELDTIKENKVNINLSEEIEVDENYCFEDVYVEFVMESEVIYRVYPGIYASTTYAIAGGAYGELAAEQEGTVIIISSEGKEYKSSLLYY